MEWNKTKDYDDLLKADEKSIQRNLEDYLRVFYPQSNA